MIFSIITINKNNSKGLQLTIDSVKRIVKNLNYKVEHILIDGNSTDQSLFVLNRYKSENNSVFFVSEEDNGIYDAMNKGIKHATGDFLLFLNSGDYLIEFDFSLISNITEFDIIYANILSEDGIYKPVKNIGLLSFLDGGIMAHPATFIRRDLFIKFGYYEEDYKIISDWIFFFKALIIYNCKAIYCDIDFTFFNKDGISNSEKGILLAEQEKLQFLELNYPRLFHDISFIRNRLQLSIREKLRKNQFIMRVYKIFYNK